MYLDREGDSIVTTESVTLSLQGYAMSLRGLLRLSVSGFIPAFVLSDNADATSWVQM